MHLVTSELFSSIELPLEFPSLCHCHLAVCIFFHQREGKGVSNFISSYKVYFSIVISVMNRKKGGRP